MAGYAAKLSPPGRHQAKNTGIALSSFLNVAIVNIHLVLELVEGDTLADRIKAGPIPVEESLKLALQIAEARQVMRFDYELPEGQQFSYLNPLAVSPDGQQFVYGTTKGLYLRSVDELSAKLIAGTEGPAQQPFFSPDGKSIGYFSPTDRQLKKISVNGGAPVTLCSVAGIMLIGASWSADDTIVFGQGPGDIMRVSANGGTPESLIKAKSAVSAWPHELPDGKWMAYMSNESGSMKVYAHSFPEVNKGRWQISTKGGVSPLWAPNGRELFYFSTDDDPSVMTVAVETGTDDSQNAALVLIPNL
jgi:hypothetical protein